MKKILLFVFALLSVCTAASSADVKTLTWAQVCDGRMGAEWYATEEAESLANVVIAVQKNNGGWMKNDQLNKLTETEFITLKNTRNEHSCLDNGATTMEMRFMAKVYQGRGKEEFKASFQNALDMIFTAEKSCGGWSQYWPLSGNDSYQDYITFNDDLVTNVMKLLRDIRENKGDFKDIVDEQTRAKCTAAFDRAIAMIIKCQVDDNGTKAAWCAQHDPEDFLPTEGRPHELPSISGYESASLLSFLMTIDKPSPELQECISSAIAWLDSHKINDKAIEDFTNADGNADRRIIDKPGNAIWGRFIQIGGKSGERIYNKLFLKLLNRGKKRDYTYGGKTYTYTEYEIANSSYDETKAYQPIYAIYSNDYAHLFYRFLYNYADTDPVVDAKGCPVATSLMAGNRSSYQYLGSWCQNVINVEYKAWKQKVDAINAAGEATLYTLSKATFSGESNVDGANIYSFNDGFSISNTKGKAYGGGIGDAIKFSAGVDYTINIPETKKITKITLSGYSNYDADAYVSKLNGETFEATQFVFPAKNPDPVQVSHTFDFSSAPVAGTLLFNIGNKQCGLTFSVYCMDKGTDGITTITTENRALAPLKCIDNGSIVIVNGDKKFTTSGQRLR